MVGNEVGNEVGINFEYFKIKLAENMNRLQKNTIIGVLIPTLPT